MKATARPSPPEPPLRPWRALAALGAAWVLSVADARAQSMDLHGRLELQDAGESSRGDSLASALGAREANDAFGDLRLVWEPAWGRWSLSVHGVVAAED